VGRIRAAALEAIKRYCTGWIDSIGVLHIYR
jgi:hypothetical protein